MLIDEIKSIESRSEVALGNINLDLIILPAGFADPTIVLRPSIAIEFSVRDDTVVRAEDQIRRHILVNDTGSIKITRPTQYYMRPSQ